MRRPRLVTARLCMDPLSAADLDAAHALLADPQVRRYLCDDVILPQAQVAGFVDVSERLFDEYGAGLWCVRGRDGGDALAGLAGYFWFHDQLELLYALAPGHWGRGYATEASSAALAFGFDVCGFDRVVASTDPPNVASLRVMERLGMRFVERRVADERETVFYAVDRASFEPANAELHVVEEDA